MTRLTVVRHGETEWNLEGRLTNSLDSSLTKKGEWQADCVAWQLTEEDINGIFSSPQGRALETTKCICEILKQPFQTREGLSERKLGVFEGLTREEIRSKYSYEHNRYRTEADYVVPLGESAVEFHRRTESCLRELVNENPEKHLLIVAHGGTLEVLIRMVMNLPITATRPPARLPNCALNGIDIDEDRWLLRSWGDVRHLKI